MLKLVWRLTCDNCNAKIESSSIIKGKKIKKFLDIPSQRGWFLKNNAESWFEFNGAYYCSICKRSAMLAIKGDKAFAKGGQTWVDWNSEALDFGDNE